MPQTNIRIDGLVAVNYRVKIVFEDTTKEAINSNVYTQNAISHEYVEATYRIKRTKKGELKLRLFSSTPVAPGFTPTPDLYIIHYGSTTTTTTTTVNNQNNASINVNIPDVQMNVNAQPGFNASMNVNVGNNGRMAGSQTTGTRKVGSADCHFAMDGISFDRSLAEIRDELSSTVKENKAAAILANNCLSTDQVIEISKVLGSDIDRLIFVRKAYPRVTDQGSYPRVQYIFSDQLRIKEFNEFLANVGQ
jgi:hypothetical protein